MTTPKPTITISDGQLDIPAILKDLHDTLLTAKRIQDVKMLRDYIEAIEYENAKLKAELLALRDSTPDKDMKPDWKKDRNIHALDPLIQSSIRPDRDCRECGAPYNRNHAHDCWTGQLEMWATPDKEPIKDPRKVRLGPKDGSWNTESPTPDKQEVTEEDVKAVAKGIYGWESVWENDLLGLANTVALAVLNLCRERMSTK